LRCCLQNVLLHLMTAHPEDDPLRPEPGGHDKAGPGSRETGQKEEEQMPADKGAVFHQRSTLAVKQVWSGKFYPPLALPSTRYVGICGRLMGPLATKGPSRGPAGR
jgi:hypothetical protein